MPAGRLSTLNVAEYGLRLRLLEEYCLVEQVTGGPGCRHPRG